MSTTERFTALDPLLPPPPPEAGGERITAVTAIGERVSGVLQRYRHGPGDVALLWSAEQVWQLFPNPGISGTAGFDALLGALRSRMDNEQAEPDSACVVNWPSRDAEAIRAFLDHGMVPMAALAVRTGQEPPAPEPDGPAIRSAGPEDLDTVLALCTATFDYTGLVAHRRRAQTAELLRPALRHTLDEPATWLAEENGAAVGLAQCAWVESEPGNAAAELLPTGRWGYVNNVVTATGHRSRGIGRALMARAHRELNGRGTAGTYLYYNPINPLSSVFWHRQGYRPLWTSWEAHPASALR
ncbi:ribosomal protein S18 acetylase RimI-like enzyme [Amycolatopsis sulphurea]|uniref:Ribosomal protein S18 acetylase RimI-like enzyme n=1 Tax=Amycolatopsis sulphurea TaxID=76022 RepID=A0A2A9FIJ1_9PSEU|nr:GNAT family N-acetyltransferase [Amycolatopsis sulphurea]PFG50753.1 ribosomal protein S18 acetylase RimI-like enzyme [Amycolatopsis sulphurea]